MITEAYKPNGGYYYSGYYNKGENMGSASEAVYGYKNERSRTFQVGGTHYCSHNIQPIDIIREYKMDFFEGNALKYLLRYKDKNGIQDLDKAIDYINMIKDNLKNNKG